jgi:hypothetical protein
MGEGGPIQSLGRYMAGLCVAALGLCAGGWLVLTPFAFGYPGRGRAAVTALSSGAALVAVCAAALACWAVSWRRRLRADGVLPPRQSRRSRRSVRRQAKAERLVRAARQRELVAAPDPAQVLTDLRALLTPLLAEGGVDVIPAPGGAEVPPEPAEPAEVVEIPEADSRQVQAPGHLRGTRSASFFADPRPADPGGTEPADGSLLRGAELLMVGTGEEEAW